MPLLFFNNSLFTESIDSCKFILHLHWCEHQYSDCICYKNQICWGLQLSNSVTLTYWPSLFSDCWWLLAALLNCKTSMPEIKPFHLKGQRVNLNLFCANCIYWILYGKCEIGKSQYIYFSSCLGLLERVGSRHLAQLLFYWSTRQPNSPTVYIQSAFMWVSFTIFFPLIALCV